MKIGITYKNLLAWILLLTYFLNLSKIYQPYLNYQINYEYITTVLCVNKEKPSVGCNGKCHLSKELKKTAEEESQKSNSGRTTLNEELPVEKYSDLTPKIFIIEEKSYAQHPIAFYSFSLDSSNPPPQI